MLLLFIQCFSNFEEKSVSFPGKKKTFLIESKVIFIQNLPEFATSVLVLEIMVLRFLFQHHSSN